MKNKLGINGWMTIVLGMLAGILITVNIATELREMPPAPPKPEKVIEADVRDIWCIKIGDEIFISHRKPIIGSDGGKVIFYPFDGEQQERWPGLGVPLERWKSDGNIGCNVGRMEGKVN